MKRTYSSAVRLSRFPHIDLDIRHKDQVLAWWQASRRTICTWWIWQAFLVPKKSAGRVTFFVSSSLSDLPHACGNRKPALLTAGRNRS
jgi:hypothetical protein